MAVRKLSLRHIRFTIARGVVRSVPSLQSKMPFYDRVSQMIDVGEAQIVTERQGLALDRAGASFAAKLPVRPPLEIERSIALIKLRDATVLGATGTVVDEKREQLLAPRGARREVTYHDFRPVISTPVEKPDGLYFNMMGPHRGYRHYFHFMFDRLPRLYYLLKVFDAGREPITVVTNTELPRFQADIYRFLQKRHPNLRFEAIPPAERWRIRSLLHIDDYQPIKRTVADRRMLEFVRALVFDGYEIPQRARGSRRIYVSRNDTPRRRVSNEQSLLPILDDFGFEVISPGRLGFPEQVALFGDAEAVVGPHGAGLTNILFSPSATRMLELFPAGDIRGTYFLLALSLGQSHRALTGGPGSRKQCFAVDPDEFRQQLGELLELNSAAAQ